MTALGSAMATQLVGDAGSSRLIVAECFGADTPTFQGEGPSCGHPALFIRLSRCNLTCARCEGALAPFELRAQVVVFVFLPGDEVAHLCPRDMDHAVLDDEDVIGVGVESGAGQEGIEPGKVFAVEENDGGTVARNAFCLAKSGCRA